MRNPKEKTHRKKRVQYDVCNKLLFRETLSLILANIKLNSYQCTQHIRNVEYGRLFNISTRLSHYLFCKCSYVHITYGAETSYCKNITLSITCLHLHNTSCIIFIGYDYFLTEIQVMIIDSKNQHHITFVCDISLYQAIHIHVKSCVIQYQNDYWN